VLRPASWRVSTPQTHARRNSHQDRTTAPLSGPYFPRRNFNCLKLLGGRTVQFGEKRLFKSVWGDLATIFPLADY
jgi:hypothetical protein